MPRRAQRVSADLRRQAAQGPVSTGAGRPSGMLFQVLTALCVCRFSRASLSLTLSFSFFFCAPSAKTDRRFGAARWRRPLARSASAQPIGAGAKCAVLVARVVEWHHASPPRLRPRLDSRRPQFAAPRCFGGPRVARGSHATAAPPSPQACNAATRQARRAGQKRQDRGAMLRRDTGVIASICQGQFGQAV